MTIDDRTLSKVPAVTLGFWLIKILATTLGETGGDTVTMTLGWGYLAGAALFAAALVVLVVAQIRARAFNAWLYWATIIASTTFGTALADFADRSLGIGYTGGSTLLLTSVLAVLGLWYWSEGTVSVNSVSAPRAEAFYWATITFSQTLGTALGDWAADTGGLGYGGGALLFGAGLVDAGGSVLLHADLPRGAVLGGLRAHPAAGRHGRGLLRQAGRQGGLALSRPLASLILTVAIVVLVSLIPQRPGRHPATRDASSPDDAAALAIRMEPAQHRQGRARHIFAGTSVVPVRTGFGVIGCARCRWFRQHWPDWYWPGRRRRRQCRRQNGHDPEAAAVDAMKVSLTQAIATAEQHTGGKAYDAGVDTDHGTTIVVETNGPKGVQTVTVDANSGKILSEHQGGEQD